ncbi:MAG: aminotransferase class IV [Bacteroidales bacterium]|nr:aminotransferase class IV [Bacteroidales bacterium]
MKLLETIRFENGEFAKLELHQQRMNASRKELFNAGPIDFVRELSSLLQASKPDGIFKCRIIYSTQIEKMEFIPYRLPQIHSLKMVIDDEINYSHKLLDRNQLDKLFSQKGDCDDILIVKNGLVTDTSFANILFFNGKQWLTPNQPLLKGTQRQFLLETEQVATADIRPDDLKYFQKVRLVNAMMRFEDEVDIQPNGILLKEN